MTVATGSHEPSRIYLPAIILFLILLAFSAILIHAGLWGWLRTLNSRATSAMSIRTQSPPTGKFPRLQVNPRGDWASYRAEQERLLKTYAWIDRTSGVVRIPIERAIDYVLAHGLPHWNTNAAPASPLAVQQARATKPRATYQP